MVANPKASIEITASNRMAAAFDTARKQLKGLDRTAEVARRSLATLGTAIGIGALTAAVGKAASVAREIQTLADVSNASTTEFQRNAAAAREVGVEQTKLGDIYKDVNDKVGEFLQTGGGQLKEFFDKIAPQIGVTAAQFRNLSGPQALQLYVDSLERANLSQRDMTFYMEAISNDSTKLLPLLEKGGEGFRKYGDAAERLNQVLSEQQIAALTQAKTSLDNMSASLSRTATMAAATLAPAVEAISDELTSRLSRALEDSRGDVVDWGKTLGDTLAFAADATVGSIAVIGAGFKTAGTTVGAGVAQLVAILEGELGQASEIGQEWLADQKEVWSKLANDTNLRAYRDRLAEIRGELESSKFDNLLVDVSKRLAEAQAGTAGDAGQAIDAANAEARARQQQALEAQLSDVIASTRSEEEVILDATNRRLAIVSDAYSQGLLAQQSYYELSRKLTEQGEAEITAVEQRNWTARQKALAEAQAHRVQSAIDGLVELTSATATSSKTMFQANKALAIAQALLHAKGAILGAYDYGAGIGGPILGGIYAAIAAAATAAHVQAIRATTFGGGTTPSAAGTTPTVSSVPVTQTQAPSSPNADSAGGRGSVSVNVHIGSWLGRPDEQTVRELADLLHDFITQKDHPLLRRT